jgi:hypothetical protein
MSFIGYTIVCEECGYRRSDLRVSQSELREIQLRGCPRCGAKNWDSFWVCNCDGSHIDRHCSCDRCNSQEPSSSSGGCFLTTVVCSVLGYDDNCIALDNLRNFRSNFLEKTGDGRALLSEYGKISNIVAPKILSDDNKDTLCDYVYNDYIMPVNVLVNANRNEDAVEKYKEMVTYFMERYGINESE